MLYIHTALKPEAQAFIDRYKLNKKKFDKFIFYTNGDISVIVSGVGIERTETALKTLAKHFSFTSEDIFINVGICGASHKYNIGELIEIASIKYNNRTYSFKHHVNTSITCVDTPQSIFEHEIVDMESFGFYNILKDITKQIYIFKVVSDHFEPHKVNKEATKKLIFNAIDDINHIIKKGSS